MLIGIFYSQVVESSSLVSVLIREAISHPYISFLHLLVNGFSVISFRTFSKTPYLLLYWWAVSVGGEELKWRQVKTITVADLEIKIRVFRYACSLWSTKQHEHTHNFLNKGNITNNYYIFIVDVNAIRPFPLS